MKKLLIEYFYLEPTKELLKESTNPVNGRSMTVLTGKIQAADTPNWNGRIYPRNVLEREVTKYQSFIKRRNALGELDHPDKTEISLTNSALNILRTWWQGHEVWADIQVLTTSKGREVKSLLDDGITIAISSRGMGSVESNGKHEIVQPDFSLVGWDFVHQPSTDEAYLTPKGHNNADQIPDIKTIQYGDQSNPPVNTNNDNKEKLLDILDW